MGGIVRKFGFFITCILAAVAAACCVALFGCADGTRVPTGDETTDTEYSITWTVGDHATVAAVGYDSLPTKLKSGTVVTFSVTMDGGGTLLGVSPTNSVAKQEDGTYKFTVTKNIEIKVLTLPDVLDVECDITWNIGDNVTVTATEYDELPQKLTLSAVVKFTAEPAEGYTATVSSNIVPEIIVKQANGEYIFAVPGNITVTVTATRNADLRVTMPQDARFYAGNAFIVPEGFTVTADGVEIDAGDYTVEYQTDAHAFALGDTGFTVKYGGSSKAVTLGAPVRGRIVLDALGESFDTSAYEDLDDFTYSESLCEASWTFAEPNAQAIPLPVPTSDRYIFAAWTTIDGDRFEAIPANNTASLKLYAKYCVMPCELTSVSVDDHEPVASEKIDDFTRDVHLNPIRVSGEFAGAKSIALRLVDADGGYIDGDKIQKTAPGAEFTAVMNIHKILDVYGDAEYSTELFTLWMVAEYDDETLVLPITLPDDNSVQLNRGDYHYEYLTSYYRVFLLFDSNAPIDVPDGGLCVTLNRSSLDVFNASAVLKVDETSGKPMLVVTGPFRKTYVRADAERILNGLVKDICVFNDWDNKLDFTQSAVLADDWTYTLTVDVSALRVGNVHVMHLTDDLPVGDGNFLPAIGNESEIVTNGLRYTLYWHETGWGWKWTAIKVADARRSMDISEVKLEVAGEKLYYVISYNFMGYTEEELNTVAKDVFFDLQGNPYMATGTWNGDWTRYKGFTVAKLYDGTNGKYTIKLDLTTTASDDEGNETAIFPNSDYCYTTHFGFAEVNTANDGIQAPDFKPDIPSFTGPIVEFGGKLYQLLYTKGGGDGAYYGCVGLRIVTHIINSNPVSFDVVGDKAYLVISGECWGYASADDLSVDCQNPDDGWSRTTFTSEQISATYNSEDHSFTIRVDISSLANGQYLVHVNGADVGNESGISPLTYGEKTASYEFRSFGTWTRYVLTIADAPADQT